MTPEGLCNEGTEQQRVTYPTGSTLSQHKHGRPAPQQSDHRHQGLRDSRRTLPLHRQKGRHGSSSHGSGGERSAFRSAQRPACSVIPVQILYVRFALSSSIHER